MGTNRLRRASNILPLPPATEEPPDLQGFFEWTLAGKDETVNFGSRLCGRR